VEVDAKSSSCVVKARNPQRFFADFGRLVVQERLEVHGLEPLDESAHAILGYLLGGSGKT
jgi:ABC-2 type transport system ATP-binding protein